MIWSPERKDRVQRVGFTAHLKAERSCCEPASVLWNAAKGSCARTSWVLFLFDLQKSGMFWSYPHLQWLLVSNYAKLIWASPVSLQFLSSFFWRPLLNFRSRTNFLAGITLPPSELIRSRSAENLSSTFFQSLHALSWTPFWVAYRYGERTKTMSRPSLVSVNLFRRKRCGVFYMAITFLFLLYR